LNKLDRLFEAIIKNEINTIKLLINDSSLNIADNDNNALLIASKEKRYDILELLLNDPRVDPSVGENSILLLKTK
jgi:hypothetical protein